MKVLLKRAARIMHPAGDIVEVSPDVAQFLLSTGSAELVRTVPAPAVKNTKKATKAKE